MQNKMKFSVLMSVYHKENHIYFQQAVESVIQQTVKPTEIVIVKDGKLTRELEFICNQLMHKYPRYIRFISLKENVGLGLALQKGVLECKYELIARMDTDDISKSDRFEKQLKAFQDNTELSICGGYIEEFSDSLQQIDSIRCVPLGNKSIYAFSKKRNPFNHMSVMFKKKDVLEAGNYQPFHLLEDYYLWFRMIMLNKQMLNLPDVLVSVRAGDDMIFRRGGWRYFKNEKKLFDEFLQQRYISIYEYLYIIIVRLISRIIPNFVRGKIYNIFFRCKPVK